MSPTETSAPASQRRPRRSSAETTEHVLDVAARLFYWEGIRATGVDRIAAEAEVAPTTLYRLFASKDDLVAAYIEASGREYRDLIDTATADSVGTARERILSLFAVFGEMISPEVCRGCPFLMALAEFPDPASPVHSGSVSHKVWVRERLHELTRALGEETDVADPAALADQLALVIEGVYGSVQALSADGPALQAEAAAEALIASAERRA
jgi:AcrR family transcriptional regulator